MDQQTSLDAIADDDVVDDETGDDVTIHGGGTLGINNFTSPKASPFGTFTGTQIFGARGILFKNLHSSDTQAYILTSDEGTLRVPPNTVALLVSNTVAGDTVYAARDTGVAGVIDKDQFGGCAVTAISAKSISVSGTIDNEIPIAGWVRVIAVDEQQEHHYKYDSATKGAGGSFTLTDITASTATAGTSETALVDTSGNFVSEGVEPGMLIRNENEGGIYEVVSVTDGQNLVIQYLYGTTGFSSGDTYTINETIHAYDTNDNIHDLILDVRATGTTINNTFIKTLSADFGIVVHVRKGKSILPFAQNVTVQDNGASVTVVRTDDTIAT